MGSHRMPAAEVDVSPDLVRRLLAVQQPDLAQLPVAVMANGWDNVICRVGDALVARLPRRAAAARLLANEQRWLPVLAPQLPVPVPAPVRVGQPGLGYPWPWSIVRFLPGRVAAQNPPADPAEAAVSVGGFLGALHAPAAPGAPVSSFRGIPLAGRDATFSENLSIVGGLVDRAVVTRVWEAALAAPLWAGPPVWLHGDLHPANILVHRGRISGVIDFGDITSGDPATDLSVAWMLLPAGSHDAFRDAYRSAVGNTGGNAVGNTGGGTVSNTGGNVGNTGGGAAGDDTWSRARGWALALSLVFLAYSADNPLLSGIGRRTLSAVLA